MGVCIRTHAGKNKGEGRSPLHGVATPEPSISPKIYDLLQRETYTRTHTRARASSAPCRERPPRGGYNSRLRLYVCLRLKRKKRKRKMKWSRWKWKIKGMCVFDLNRARAWNFLCRACFGASELEYLFRIFRDERENWMRRMMNYCACFLFYSSVLQPAVRSCVIYMF